MRILKLLIVVSALTWSNSAHSQIDSLVTDTSENNTSIVPQSTTTIEALNDQVENQDVSGLLQSSKDVFTSIAGFNFGVARYRVRGYDGNNYTAMMNGVTLNSPENGRAVWAYWGGLNDITRYQESKNGIAASQLGFGGIGGYSNISARASAQRKGNRVSYAYANQSYDHRLMYTTSTGMMANNLAVTVSGSLRYANEGYVEGTFYRAGSYLLSIEKKFNEKHSLGFVAYGAPTVSGGRSISTQETYDLTGNNQYNSYWGYQAGEKRNSRVRNTHKPMMMLNHYFTLNEKTKINSSIFYTFGKGGQTRLNWYDAADPRPDYYKKLPSYYSNPGDEALYALYTELWQNDVNTQQLDFDQMYFANTKNLYTVNNADGIAGNTVTGNRAKYIIEDYRSDLKQYGFNSTFNHQYSENILISGGINGSFYKSMNFKVMDDLLGADYWVDVDQFAERDFADASAAQSNLDISNHIIKVGDKFGYDYDININNIGGFGQAEGKSSKIDWYGALTLSNTNFWRTGNVANGLFPNDSKGNSEKKSFLNYGVKAGLDYKITGRHVISVNAAYLTRAPQSNDAFVSPRTRNQIIDNLKSEIITSGDLNYLVRYPNVKIRLTGFYTTIANKTWSRNFYHDELNTFVNYMMTGVDQLFIGTELGAEIKMTSTIDATGAFTMGDYTYNSRPSVTISQDNSTTLLAENKVVYFENYKIGGMPQTAASVGLKYNAPKFWFVGANFNYFMDTYLEANPDRRTAEATAAFVSTDPQIADLLDQTKLDDGYTVNLFGGKSWRLKNKYYIRINVNINNILDTKDYATGGFEQLRYDKQNIDRFPPKVGYMYGRTYFAMISFSF
ncbi:MAG: TonB-dependent receptor plug domain-containing protein [Bacteroidetes bacterium]|nr:TonB-dependent receptor plug domain-containing protein [Bacteroidota bacterium]